MKKVLLLGLMGLAAVSCKQRDFNASDAKGVTTNGVSENPLKATTSFVNGLWTSGKNTVAIATVTNSDRSKSMHVLSTIPNREEERNIIEFLRSNTAEIISFKRDKVCDYGYAIQKNGISVGCFGMYGPLVSPLEIPDFCTGKFDSVCDLDYNAQGNPNTPFIKMKVAAPTPAPTPAPASTTAPK